MQKEDLGAIKHIRNLTLSPDGKTLAYCVAGANLEKDCYESFIFVTDTASGDERQLTNGGAEHMFFFYDEGTLALPSFTPQATEYSALDIKTGDKRRLFTVPVSGAALKPLGGTLFLVQHTVDISDPVPHGACWNPDEFVVFQELPALTDGLGVVSRKRSALSLYDSATGEVLTITPRLFNVGGVYASDGMICYFGQEYDMLKPAATSVMLYDIAAGETREIARPGEPVSTVSICGGDIYYCLDIGIENHCRMYCVSAAGGETRLIRAFDRDLFYRGQCDAGWTGRSFLSRGDDIYYTLACRDGTHLIRYSGGEHTAFAVPGLHVAAVAANEHGVYAAALPPFGPMTLYTLRGGEMLPLGSRGADVMRAFALSRPRPVTVKMRDGAEVDGWVIPPPDAVPGQKYPGILAIHGGPRMYYTGCFDHDNQTLAAEGYYVFYCNYRGSSGRDTQFGEFDCGYGELEDLLDFTDGVCRAYPDVDCGRLYITGISHGGYLTNWAITHTDRFKAAAPQCSVADFISQEITSDSSWYSNRTFGDPWDDADKLWDRSPLKHIRGCRTPALLLQFENDFSVPQNQAVEMFAAMMKLGVEAKLILFRGDSHTFHLTGKPSHRVRRHEEIFAWFDRHR